MNKRQLKFLVEKQGAGDASRFDLMTARARREHGAAWEQNVDGMGAAIAADYRRSADRGDRALDAAHRQGTCGGSFNGCPTCRTLHL